MPKLGEILYNNLNNNLMNEPLIEDKDSEEKTKQLKESLEKLANFFLAMKNASVWNKPNQELFNAASKFCDDMKNKVKKSSDIINEAQNTSISNDASHEPYKAIDDALEVDIINDAKNTIISNNTSLKPYKEFDDALDLLFAEEDKQKAKSLNDKLEDLNNLARQKARKPDPQKPDRLTIEDIHNSNALYQNATSGPLEVIHTLNNLIEGINGLQTYIKDNTDKTDKKSHDAISALNAKLKENVELAKDKVIEQKDEIALAINKYLQHLDSAFTNSHRLLGNSTEYGDMLDSASQLHTEWNEVNDEKRIEYAQAAKAAAEEYIRRKKGNNKDKNWTPITKEGKKRFALAQFLRDTADGLLNKYLTNPDNKMLEKDKTIIFENDISEINNSEKNENENIISENNENKKEDDIIEENDISEINNSKKNENEDIISENNENKNEDDIIEENDLRKKNDDNKENYFIETINKKPKLSSTMHDYAITLEADDMFDNYRAGYRLAETKKDQKDLLAKAAAVNVLMHLAIKGYFKSEYTTEQLFSNPKDVLSKTIFSTKKINAVADAVKKLPSFNNQDAFANTVFKNKDKPATQLDPNDTAAKLMDTKDIIDLIDRIDKKKLLNGLPKAGPALDTSNKLDQPQVNNQYGNNQSDKKIGKKF